MQMTKSHGLMGNPEILSALSVLAREKPPEIRNYKICAAVVHKHREIIAIGHPRCKSHPVQKLWGNSEHSVYLHAEVDALLKALRLGYTASSKYTAVYVARVKQSPRTLEFQLGKALPCTGCTRFIHHCGVTQIYWTS